MLIDGTTIRFLFYGVQLVGMVAFYLYYTYRNKKAEKDYWHRVGQEV